MDTTIIEDLLQYIRSHSQEAHSLMQHYANKNQSLLLSSDIWDEFIVFCQANPSISCEESPLKNFLLHTQEAIVHSGKIFWALRPHIGHWNYIEMSLEYLDPSEISQSEYLRVKERVVHSTDPYLLEIDLAPFERNFPRMKEARSIGHGVAFLNRHLSSKLLREINEEQAGLLYFLRLHQYQGQPLMLSQRIQSFSQLRQIIQKANQYLKTKNPETPWSELQSSLETLGLLHGWGRTAVKVQETLGLLSEILEAPDPQTLEKFLGQIPMIFHVAILSPHGFFGQEKVLGLPDTGGQVIYILNQVQALEKEMYSRLWEQGLDIEPQILVISRLIPEAQGSTCDQPLEAIIGTKNAKILRVPFRKEDGVILKQWISRFEVWPYLERFTEEVQKEILAYFSGRPDLIIGNYSDGNLVATLLAQNLQVTQCNIAHALEKTKYLFADLYWQANEDRYHFSCQFTADLIAMNSADFIITSTYQEIAGQEDSIGQYESYGHFTMPQLFRVVNGIDVYDPKFNIVSPGADSNIYFPYSEKENRFTELHENLDELIYGKEPTPYIRGELKETKKPLIFSMARLDQIKNITGLLRFFAQSKELQKEANLLIIAGHVQIEKSQDQEEQEQIQIMHQLMNEYQLDSRVRWLGIQMEKRINGELYRKVADSSGVFVQPAKFEAFGLTVIEAMICGLPTFATRYGGPLEIIENQKSGFHIDPNHEEECAKLLIEFFQNCKKDPENWRRISQGGIERVQSRYTWQLYANRLMTLSRIYGFWKFVTNLEREETRKYLQMLYSLQFRPLASTIHHE